MSKAAVDVWFSLEWSVPGKGSVGMLFEPSLQLRVIDFSHFGIHPATAPSGVIVRGLMLANADVDASSATLCEAVGFEIFSCDPSAGKATFSR